MAKKYLKNIDLVQNAEFFFLIRFYPTLLVFLPLTYLKIINASEGFPLTYKKNIKIVIGIW
jgi:hypothetical protein